MINVGDVIPDFQYPPINLKNLQDYSKVSSDPNPIHLDQAAALAAGLPGVIAHGMYVAGLVASRARRWAEGQNLLSQNFHLKNSWHLAYMQTRFKGMTYLGDSLIVAGVVKSVGEEIVIDLHAQRLHRPDFDTDPLLKITELSNGQSFVTVTQAQIKFKKNF